MREDMFRSVLGYLSAMAQAKALLHQGIITQREYTHFDPTVNPSDLLPYAVKDVVMWK